MTTAYRLAFDGNPYSISLCQSYDAKSHETGGKFSLGAASGTKGEARELHSSDTFHSLAAFQGNLLRC